VKVNVKYFATLREITGKREEQVELEEDSTMGDLLKRLIDIHGPAFKTYVVEEATGSPKGHLLFLIDGVSINSIGGLNAKLSENSVVALMPPVGGG
jgi:molybdopterin synthase sulfur carrier subunit